MGSFVVRLEGCQFVVLHRGEGVVDMCTEERVNVFGGEFSGSSSILRPVGVITDAFVGAIYREECAVNITHNNSVSMIAFWK